MKSSQPNAKNQAKVEKTALIAKMMVAPYRAKNNEKLAKYQVKQVER